MSIQTERLRADAEAIRQQHELMREMTERDRAAAEGGRAAAEEGRRAATDEIAGSVATLTELLNRMEAVEEMRRAAHRNMHFE